MKSSQKNEYYLWEKTHSRIEINKIKKETVGSINETKVNETKS